MTILACRWVCDRVILEIGSYWPAGGMGITCLCKRVHMAIVSSSSTTPSSTLGAGVEVNISACLVLDTTLGGGLAGFCLRLFRRKIDEFLRVLLGWCNFGGGSGASCSVGLSHQWNAWHSAWIAAS